MLIVDGHQDIALNMRALHRDYRNSVEQLRSLDATSSWGQATIGLPESLTAGVRLVFATLFTHPASNTQFPIGTEYHNPEEAHQQALRQLDYYRELAASSAPIRLICTRRDLQAVLAADYAGQPEIGLVPLMENGDPIREPAEVAEWAAAGVRLIGPAWQATRYCGGTGQPGPLTPAGRALISAMSILQLGLDVSHMAEQSFWQALELFDGPLLASHSNCRSLLNGTQADRHLSDAMIQALIQRDAVIGIVLFNRFLVPNWDPERRKDVVGLDAVLRQIMHVCDLAGNSNHVAIGSDFDGGFGSEAIPRELDSIADLPRLVEVLARAGFTDTELEAIMGRNWLRKLEQILPEG